MSDKMTVSTHIKTNSAQPKIRKLYDFSLFLSTISNHLLSELQNITV